MSEAVSNNQSSNQSSGLSIDGNGLVSLMKVHGNNVNPSGNLFSGADSPKMDEISRLAMGQDGKALSVYSMV
ncbi:MAG: hypothetical protein AABZ57_02300 [Candidatus Margulisiibacteriota bacterium]